MPAKPGRPTHSYVAIDNGTLTLVKDMLTRVESQNKVIIINQHNARIEALELKASLDKLIALLRECLTDPQSQNEVDAVLRDFLNNKRNKEKQ